MQIVKRGYKAPFSLHKACNELEGLGGAEKRFPAFAEVLFQPGWPQFYNVLEFTFTCLLTHSLAH